MDSYTLKTGSGTCTIYFCEAFKNVSSIAGLSDCIIITDSNVYALYRSQFPDFKTIVVEPGEDSKSMRVAESVIREMLEAGADRSTFLLGIGGGVVCDLTGFIASVYMRGMDFGFISTTLLSQVDASIGGKNGVNLDGVKNIVGTINQPSFVICDMSVLRTLPAAEYVSGLGEIVKYALIRDTSMLGYIEENIEGVISGDEKVMSNLVRASVKIKVDIVSQDEREASLRRILNFGHTIGHAIEASLTIPHGLAVAHGMKAAAEFSLEMGMIQHEDFGRINSLLGRLGLLPVIDLKKGSVKKFIINDKKRKGSSIHFICLAAPGRAEVRITGVQELIDWLDKKGY